MKALYDNNGMLIIRSFDHTTEPRSKYKRTRNRSQWYVTQGKIHTCKICGRNIKNKPELWCTEARHEEYYANVVAYMREYHQKYRKFVRKSKYDKTA